MFDFPNSPTNGQTFAPIGGPVYVYTGGVWRMQGSGQVVTAEARNRIVNPAMQISQENGNTASSVNAYYMADQWLRTGTGVGAAVFAAYRIQSYTPNGSVNRIRVQVTTGGTPAAGEVTMFSQIIEGIRIVDFLWGSPTSAKQAILRFGWKGPAGTYGVAIRNSAANRTYIATFTISAGQANTDTEQVFVIPGDTTGTWLTDTSTGFNLTICLASGSTFHGAAGWQAGNLLTTSAQTNGVATNGNMFELFDVGLYLDPNATGVPPPWQMPDEAQELLTCKRYWSSYQMIVATSTTGYSFLFPAEKRIVPAVSGGGAGFTASIFSYGAVQLFQTARAGQTLIFNARM